MSLLPHARDLHQTLEAEGLRATIHDLFLDLVVLSLTVDDFDLEVSFHPSDTPDAFQLPTCSMGARDPSTVASWPVGIWIQLRRGHRCDRIVRPLCPWDLDEPPNRITSASQQPRLAHEPSKAAITTQHSRCILPRSSQCNCLRHTPLCKRSYNNTNREAVVLRLFQDSVCRPTHHLG